MFIPSPLYSPFKKKSLLNEWLHNCLWDVDMCWSYSTLQLLWSPYICHFKIMSYFNYVILVHERQSDFSISWIKKNSRIRQNSTSTIILAVHAATSFLRLWGSYCTLFDPTELCHTAFSPPLLKQSTKSYQLSLCCLLYVPSPSFQSYQAS